MPSLVSAPDWLPLKIQLNGERLSPDATRAVEHRRVLDLRRGLLIGTLKQELQDGNSAILGTVRFASLKDRPLGVQLARIGVDKTVMIQLAVDEAGSTAFEIPSQSRFLALDTEAQLLANQQAVNADETELGEVQWTWRAVPTNDAWLARVTAFAVASSADDAAHRTRDLVGKFNNPASMRRLYERHVRAWKQRWTESDVVVDGDDASQKALRFAIYHLVSAANPEDERVSVGARALSGDGYKGHVFWDTEIFMLPFYTLTWPAAARAMLMYRYHTLAAARAKAEKMGYRGALFAWESADTGEETTPPFALSPERKVVPILCGEQEHHISADIAYAVWQYWQATRDSRFLLEAGAEILLETSRFWSSRAQLENDGQYHIRRVIGPDEYHEGVDDNAFTNIMAAFNLQRGLDVTRLLETRWPQRWAALKKSLGISPDELAFWSDVRQRLITGLDPKTGLHEQFAGFYNLEEVDLSAFADRTVPIDLVLGAERTSRSQVIKQADAVMLSFLFGRGLDRRIQEANFDYYEPRTGHGSSLSPPVHAMVAARLGRAELAKRFFDETAAIDLDDTMGNAAAGVHIGALGGLWQAAVFGFAGLYLEDSCIHFDPHLPKEWQRLVFPFRWRHRQLRVEVEGHPCTLSVTLQTGKPMSLTIGGLKRRLRRGETWRCARDGDGQWREAE